MTRIFNNENLQSFKNSLEPQGIIDHIWPLNILTEKQLQELRGLKSDIGKAEYIWHLMKLKRRNLDAIKEALVATGQTALAELLQPNAGNVYFPLFRF